LSASESVTASFATTGSGNSSAGALVYVTSNPSGTTYQINAHAADSNGGLTPITGFTLL
jgi:hypothetical protein